MYLDGKNKNKDEDSQFSILDYDCYHLRITDYICGLTLAMAQFLGCVTAQQEQSRKARQKRRSPTRDAQINLAMYGAHGMSS